MTTSIDAVRHTAQRGRAGRLLRALSGMLLGGVLSLLPLSAAWGMGTQPFFKNSFLNLQEDAVEAARAGRTLLVLVEQEGCPYCTQLHKAHFADASIVARLKQHFDVVQLDLWGSRESIGMDGRARTEKQLVRDLRVQFTPTLLFFDGSGREVYRMTGLHARDLFGKGLDYVATQAYARMPFRTYAAQTAAPVPERPAPVLPFLEQSDDLAALLDRAQAADKILMLWFGERNCAACRELTERHFSNPDTQARLAQHFVVKQIDARGAGRIIGLDGKALHAAALTQAMGIQQVPTLVFIDRSGAEILRYEEHLQPRHFANGLLEFLGTHAYRQYASFPEWLRARRAARLARP